MDGTIAARIRFPNGAAPLGSRAASSRGPDLDRAGAVRLNGPRVSHPDRCPPRAQQVRPG
jgi:hypothetical protein